MPDPLLDLTEFSLTWGPLALPEPAFSFADDWVSHLYTPEEVAAAILAVPGVTLIHPAGPTWDLWAARWQWEDRWVDFDLAAAEVDLTNHLRPGIALAWGGSSFTAHCRLTDALFVWRHIRGRCAAIWLHDADGRMYSPESFARAVTTSMGTRSRCQHISPDVIWPNSPA